MSKGIAIAVGTALLVSGCAGRTVLLRNPAGDLQKCEVSATGAVLGGVIIRDMTIDKCVEEYRKAGYAPVSPPS